MHLLVRPWKFPKQWVLFCALRVDSPISTLPAWYALLCWCSFFHGQLWSWKMISRALMLLHLWDNCQNHQSASPYMTGSTRVQYFLMEYSLDFHLAGRCNFVSTSIHQEKCMAATKTQWVYAVACSDTPFCLRVHFSLASNPPTSAKATVSRRCLYSGRRSSLKPHRPPLVFHGCCLESWPSWKDNKFRSFGLLKRVTKTRNNLYGNQCIHRHEIVDGRQSFALDQSYPMYLCGFCSVRIEAWFSSRCLTGFEVSSN